MSDKAGELAMPVEVAAAAEVPDRGAYLRGVDGLSSIVFDRSLLELLPWSRWMSLLKRDCEPEPEPEPPEEASESVEAAGWGGVDAMTDATVAIVLLLHVLSLQL